MWLVLKLKVFLKTIMENGLYILKVALESRGYANLFGFRGIRKRYQYVFGGHNTPFK